MIPSTSALHAPAEPARPAWRGSRFWIGLLVTTGWLAMMALVLRHERERSGATLRRMGISPEVLLVSWNDYDSWMWIEQGGQRIGVTRLSIVANPPVLDEAPESDARHSFRRGGGDPPFKPDVDPSQPAPHEAGYTLTSLTRLARPLGVQLHLQVGMNRAFEMQTIQATFDVLGQNWNLEGFVEGLALYYRVSAPAAGFLLVAGGERIGMAPLAEPILLGDTIVPIAMQSDGFEVGKRWTMPVAMPFTGGMNLVMEIEVQARETIQHGDTVVEAWKVVERAGAVETTAWYDPFGRLLRREMGRGLRIERAEVADALDFDPAMRESPDLPPIDRPYLKSHVSPELRGKPLQDLLPQLPIF